ncbi:MAG: GNAT family N-acetyltransferase [Hyphomonas sp.]|nr:GNAT family N-acetyltransferase [Hyphomonas sp.]
MGTISVGEVREFREQDASQLLELMRGLAEFEGYIDDFAVSESDLIANGLGENRRFQAFVVPDEVETQLLGMAVTYIIPWTYDLRPVVVLKELFVRKEARQHHIGHALFDRVVDLAKARKASKVQWTVLRGNAAAVNFYQSHGARPDYIWETWQLPL